MDDVARRPLLAAHDRLDGQLDRLTAVRLRIIDDSQAVRDALAGLGAATEALNQTAQEIKTTTDIVTKIGSVIDQAIKIVGLVMRIA